MRELHVYRGHQKSEPGFIMGHEFVGEVVETGPKVVTAEYCRVPLADSTVVKAPPSVDSRKLVLMADIFPTGYFAAKSAFAGLSQDVVGSSTVVLLGCGPVGLCAIVNALEFRPQHVLAIDSVEARLGQAKALGAEPWNFQVNMQGIKDRITELTDGRGADIIIESVGHSSALRLGFDLLRPGGIISSIGVHNGEIPWTGNEAYGKNLTLKMGRCSVRSLFDEALNVLVKKQHELDFMIDNVRPMSDAVQAYVPDTRPNRDFLTDLIPSSLSYDDFHNMKYQTIIFEPGK
ncbi:hypothetical protein CEP52_013676 [Fusarium oligoseptatum]|uniref:Alcohol dehydrogenase-like C-terminal domain-containing protein n=1 Tax=Fusarium oligoseptatum TaxID=2604345 RepID=A0A428SSC0_9HYPO|nr:hypothetical protein CEP52_013676 [Fusarium oligoseptatum]